MKMKILILQLVALAICLSSCNKTEIEGMEALSIDQDVNTLSIKTNNDRPNFTSGDTLYFIGDLTKTVSVTIKITGTESGAIKTFQLNASELNAQNSSWYGGSSTLIGFQEELCDVQISFIGSGTIILDQIKIIGITSFEDDNTINLKSNGFEDISSTESLTNCAKVNDFVAPQGKIAVSVPYGSQNSYLYLGEDNLGSGYFYDLPIDPKRVWFNIYVFGTGDANARMFIEFKEADQDNLAYQNGRDDGVQAFIPLSHQGWQLFSFRYSDLGFSSVSAFGGSGNKTHEPGKIQRTTYNFENDGSEGVFYFDLPIYTIDHPFDSNNY